MDDGYITPEGHWLYKPLLMPDVKRLDEVFVVGREWRRDDNLSGVKLEGNHIGPYCSVRVGEWQHKGLFVMPTQDTVHVLRDQLVTDDDVLSFEVIEHKERERCLVLISHNHIIGSRWLAYVPTNNVRDTLKEVLT
jgi:hypothetical protein